MSQNLSLFRLQQADTQIDRIRNRLASIQEKIQNHNELSAAQEHLESTTNEFKFAEERLSKAEAVTHNHRVKIEQVEASLYGGKGHSPKELGDLEKDLFSLKKHLVTLEDFQLDAMYKVEESIQARNAAQVQLTSVLTTTSQVDQELAEEQLVIQKDLDKLLSERNAITASVPEKTLNLYHELRSLHRGVAVAIISENSCSSCGSGLSPALIQSARNSTSLVMCPSCGRILYG